MATKLNTEAIEDSLLIVQDLPSPVVRPEVEHVEVTAPELEKEPEAVLIPAEQPEDASSKKRPLQLLDLPLDILKEIVKEVTHTNDLTSLALTHSSLHELAIPHIYSRFDIVWPDALPTSDPRSGVDALTYGLATLVMGEEIFGESPSQLQHFSQTCSQCGHQAEPQQRPRRRRGNHYAQYTRKFSLGNGPPVWVQEYNIAKEGGKMLGTLIALALARMPNLETFTWDMPSGILRDVWLALASLADRRDGRECRLERIWVRWHDNRDAALAHETHHLHPASAAQIQSPLASLPLAPHIHNPLMFLHVEHPTFSCLPPLKSLSVLDIDELPYLDELSVLVKTSQDRLRELRIGIAKEALKHPWALGDWESELLEQVDHNAGPSGISAMSLANGKRLGGVLGVIVGRIHDMRKKRKRIPLEPTKKTDEVDGVASELSTLSVEPTEEPLIRSQVEVESEDDERPRLDGKLKLEILELERVVLAIPVLQRAFDWSIMTTLTILSCPHHEMLWKMLRRVFAPRPLHRTKPSKPPGKTPKNVPLEYQLKLKKVHANQVSPSLIAFLRETLAPNSLETLFLQESHEYASTVSIDSIYRGPIRRHKTSLKKVLVDSSLKGGQNSWKKWLFPLDVLESVTNGQMSSLRELGMALEYKNWHTFLTRLPKIPHLRSLYIPNIADHVHKTPDAREMALQILDIVTLRPDIEICYMGILTKCFEVLENKNDEPIIPPQVSTPVESDEETEDEDEEDVEVEELDSDVEDSDSDDLLELDDSDDEFEEKGKIKLRLREILFYDDKVAVFKARHGRL